MRTLRLLMVWTMLGTLSACSNLTGLPEVPEDLTAEDVGMADLERALHEAQVLEAPVNEQERTRFAAQPPQDALQQARWALHRLAAEDFENGLRLLGEALESDPESLVLGNAYRVAVHHLKLRARAEEIPLDILYEDDDLAAINKPAGMTVHAGGGRQAIGVPTATGLDMEYARGLLPRRPIHCVFRRQEAF